MSPEAGAAAGPAGLVGHEEARRAALFALSRGRLEHALLVTGETGIGKRLFGEWLVAARWCESLGAAGPCGACASCRRLASRNHPDVEVLVRDPSEAEDPEGLGSRHEITVDQVRRRLLPWLALRPVLGRGRAVLVDGADEMNEAAQNALLKTLEEPPPRCLVLLLATHEEALLETVRSRCQVLRLQPLADDELLRLDPTLDEVTLRAARGRPGRVAALRRLDAAALAEALDALIEGRLGGAAFATRVLEIVGEEPHALAAEILLQRLLDRAGRLGEPLEPARGALMEVVLDLRRHLAPGVSWTAAGIEIASAAVVGREEAGHQG